MVINGLLMTGAWFFLPTGAQDALFTVHASFAFPLVLSSWMYADVPATNILGSGAAETLQVLEDPRALRRLIAARNAVLWIFVTPICVAVAIGAGIYEGDAVKTILVIAAIMVPPFGALGLSGLVGVWFPYHPIPLKERWQLRTTSRWHMLWRWFALVVTPYGVVPFFAVMTVLPAYLYWAATGGGLGTQVGHGRFAIGVLMTAGLSIALWSLGLWLDTRIVRKRRDALAAYLVDPTRG